jgi:hypothetical protein
MIQYFVTDSDGRIIQTGYCNLESELPTGEVHRGGVPFGASHYVNGIFETRENLEMLRIQAFQRRNALLVGSDWTQLPDVLVDKGAWSVYRQALRDVPQQPGFPLKIDWPVAP